MNTEKFAELLARAFARTEVTELHGSEVRELRKPRPLATLLEKSLEAGEERSSTPAPSRTGRETSPRSSMRTASTDRC